MVLCIMQVTPDSVFFSGQEERNLREEELSMATWYTLPARVWICRDTKTLQGWGHLLR